MTLNATSVERQSGVTPLHRACFYGSLNAVRTLLPTHDPTVRTMSHGHSAFDLAAVLHGGGARLAGVWGDAWSGRVS